MALVIIMGVFIVVGLVVVVVTIAKRTDGGATATVASPAAASFGSVDLPVPPGCQVLEASAADERLILRLGSGERCNQVLIVDLSSGRLLGTLQMVPAP